MPVSAVLVLRPLAPLELAAAPGKSLYAAVLRAIALARPDVAAAIHQGDGPAPLAISALGGPGDRHRGRLRLDEDHLCWLRVSGLDDGLMDVVTDALAPRGQVLVVDGRELEVVALETHPDGHRAADRCTHADLEAVPPVGGRLTLRFDSPTRLRSDPHDVLFPAPEAVLGSVARRLERTPGASPLETGPELQAAVAAHLTPARYDLGTKVFRGDGGSALVGFVGEVTYHVVGDPPPALRRDVARLAAAAFFSGVGAKVAWGMGQCRRILDPKRR